MTIRTGTSGFSYKEWKGSFYPDDLPAPKMLSYYSGRLGAVEINNTFYRMPRTEVLEGWTEQTPADFRFVLKASRRITHFKRLNGVEEEVEYFLRTAGSLGERLGAVLFQLPPNLKKDLDRLRTFLDLLGAPERTAMEFRHPSWHEEDVIELLTERRVSLCAADTDESPAELLATGPLGYLRLRRTSYEPGELAEWKARVRDAGWREAFVFFKHEDAGSGPLLAEAFAADDPTS